MPSRKIYTGLVMVIVVVVIGITVGTNSTFANSRSTLTSMSVCTTHDLIGTASLQGETGYQVGILMLENKRLKSCRLPTRLSVKVVWHGKVLAIHQISMADEQSRSFGTTALSVLKPHAKSAVGLMWHNWCHTLPLRISPSSELLIVTLSHSSSQLKINMKNLHPARCDLPSEHSTLAVGRFRTP